MGSDRTFDRLSFVLLDAREKPVADISEEFRWQRTMRNRRVIASGHETQVRSWPRELICLGEHDSGAVGIESQTLSQLRKLTISRNIERWIKARIV